jgi:ABC-type molybdate transport system, ATPase component
MPPVPHLTVQKNLIYGAERRGKRLSHSELSSVVDMLEIAPLLSRRPHSLSGGERQRVAIGRALLCDPAVLLMDEPLAALDGSRKAEVLPYIRRLQSEIRTPLIYVSHALEEIAEIADQVALMDGGRVVALDPLERLSARLELHPLTGRYEAGAFVTGTVQPDSAGPGMVAIALDEAGQIILSHPPLPAGQRVRIRIKARDVSLSTQTPEGLSIQNRFHGKIVDFKPDEDGPMVEVLVDVGQLIWVRVTKHAWDQLDLRPGMPIWTLIKSVAIDRVALDRPRNRS